MIDCREAVARMWAYLSEGLETHDADALEEHLGVCQRCCGELEFSRQLRERVAEAGARPIPPPDPRSRTTSPGANAACRTGLPTPRAMRIVSSGRPSSSSAEYMRWATAPSLGLTSA
ncbi:MAG TPA: zf-HC2 domain-containing protein [Candidatus Limnocylindria bacterium]